jgi:GntR family transcriptional regulator
MEVTIVTSSPEPVYEQIVRQIHAGVAGGDLAPGAALPTVRQLADDLQINRNTVARAYKQLEDQGVIQTAGRKGTFVRSDAAKEVTALRAGTAERSVRHMVGSLLGEGWTQEQIAALFDRALHMAAAERNNT